MAGKWTKVGTIYKGKEGKSPYMKIENDVALKKGQFVSVLNPRNRKGITDEELAKIPDFVMAEVLIGPPRE